MVISARCLSSGIFCNQNDTFSREVNSACRRPWLAEIQHCSGSLDWELCRQKSPVPLLFQASSNAMTQGVLPGFSRIQTPGRAVSTGSAASASTLKQPSSIPDRAVTLMAGAAILKFIVKPEKRCLHIVIFDSRAGGDGSV